MAGILRGLMDPETLVVASSDFTHYGPNYRFVPFREDVPKRLETMDKGALEAMRKGGAEGFREYVKETGATICGREAVTLLLEMQPADAGLHLLKYDTSGRITGDYSNSVSYMSIAMTGAWEKGSPVPGGEGAGGLAEGDKEALLALARSTIDHALRHRQHPTAGDLGVEPTRAMSARRAAFVTLEKQGVLRGCVGGIYATRPLYREVMIQAVGAAFHDSRFPRLRASELEEIHLEISVLTHPKTIPSTEEIVIGRDGIILEKEGKRALFLPQVAQDQGWDLPETLRHLCMKAGLPLDAWKEGATLWTFQAEVFGEPEE
jgi:AmmeMemoRadiSam system protein A